MKTASRILGSAAFGAGFVVQDSPVYGAEPRGAPITAFTRMAREPILERGPIVRADLVVIADETLLTEPTAQPLAGCDTRSAVLLNSTREVAVLRSLVSHGDPLYVMDFTALAFDMTRTLASLSTALGVAAACLVGLRREDCLAGLAEELHEAHLTPPQCRANQQLAHTVYDQLSIWKPLRPQPEPLPLPSPPLVTIAYEPPWRAAPSIYAVGNSPQRRTGSWRQSRPVLNAEQCSRCWLCFVWCPEGAIALDGEDLPVVDYETCKGCLLCAHECPTQAFRVEKEGY